MSTEMADRDLTENTQLRYLELIISTEMYKACISSRLDDDTTYWTGTTQLRTCAQMADWDLTRIKLSDVELYNSRIYPLIMGTQMADWDLMRLQPTDLELTPI